MPLTDPGREKDLCTKVWDCIMQKVTSGREKRKQIALRAVCADQPPAAFGTLTRQLQPCRLLPACHFHKIVTALLPCVPHGPHRDPLALCVHDVTHSTEKAGKLCFPMFFCLLPPQKGGSRMFCMVVYQAVSLCFHFQGTSKEEDTPINVLHDNKLGKHHFWMQLMEDWLLPLPSGRLS